MHKYWRNKQLDNSSALLKQELGCLEFINSHPNVKWKWVGTHGPLYDLCNTVDTDYTGLVIINYPLHTTPKVFVDTINSLLTNSVTCVYLAINRYTFEPVNDLNLDYPDELGSSIDLIVSKLSVPFVKQLQISEADGKHFVGVHGLDIYTYERN